MSVKTVHLAVFDILADWEPGYAVAAINDPQYQRNAGHSGCDRSRSTASP